VLARFRPDLIGVLATHGAVCFWLPTSLCQTLLMSLSCVAVCVGRVIAVLRDMLFVVYDFVYICMSYMLVSCKVERMS